MPLARAEKCRSLLAIRNPDILNLRGMLEKPATLSQLGIEPVDHAPFVRPHLLQIAHRHRLRSRSAGLIAEAPDGIDIIMLGKRLQKLRSISSDNIYCAARQIAGVEKLVKIARNQRVCLRRNGHRRVPNCKSRHHHRNKSKQRRFSRADDADRPNRLVHGDRNIAERRIMYRAVKLIGPSRVRENALDAELPLRRSLLFTDRVAKPMGNLLTTLRKIFRAIIKNLRAIVRRGLRPRAGLPRCFDSIANIFTISQRSFTEQSTIRRAHLHAIARVRARLLAPDVKLDGAVDLWAIDRLRITVRASR